MIRQIRILIAAFLLGMLPLQVAGLDPQQPVDGYILDQWDEHKGLNFLTIYNIMQSSDGFLWLEGPETVVRFDGKQFIPAEKLNLPYTKKKPRYFFCISHKDKEGGLWLIADKGLIKYRNNRFGEYISIKQFPREDFNMAIEDSWGNFWLGTIGGYLYSFKNKKLVTYGKGGKDGKEPQLSGISCLLEDARGQLWVSTNDRGVYTLKSGKLTRAVIPGLKPESHVTWMYDDKSGHSWIGTEKGLALRKKDSLQWFTTQQGMSGNLITDIIEDSDANLWIGTTKGLNRLKIDKQGTVTINSCLRNEIINVLFEDNERNLWIGTEGSGLKRLRDRMLVTESFKTDRQDYISAIHYTRTGETWVATLFGDLYRYGSSDQYSCGDYITAICDDRRGNLWIGTNKNGLFCLTPGRTFIHFTDEKKLNQIFTMFCDSQNRLWIGCRNGITLFQCNKHVHGGIESGPPVKSKIVEGRVDNRFIDLRKIKKIPHYAIQFISENTGGDIFIGSYNGLATLEKGKIGDPRINVILKNDSIAFVLNDKEHPASLWIGSYGGGLILKIKDKIFSYMENGIRLPFDAINSMMTDEFGYIWFSSNAGICRLNRKVLTDVAEGRAKAITSKRFGVSDGLKSAECTGSSFNAAIKTGSGQFLFATKKGVAVFRPEKVKLNKNPPPVFVEEVRVNGKAVTITNPGIPYSIGNAKRLRINFTAPTYIGQERVLFKFRLENHDDEWSWVYPGDRRSMEYWNLPDGDYTFNVTACNSDGVWNGEGAHFRFEIYSGFFKSTTFYFILVVVIVILVLLIHWFADKKKRIKTKVKKAQIDALDAISSDKYLVRLFRLLEEEKVYRDDSVSLNSLSEKITVSPRILSRLINEKLDKSFYDLINHYRIEDAKYQLLDDRNDKAILEIAYDVGFNTKSSFNRAFKKETDMTPSQFKKSEVLKAEKFKADKTRTNSKKFKTLRNQRKEK